jgi:hypothetical protein
MRATHFLIILGAGLALNSCEKQTPEAAAEASGGGKTTADSGAAPVKQEAAAEEEAAEVAPAETSADALFAAPPKMVDLNGFGSEDPVERADRPERGVLRIAANQFLHSNMEHWEQFDCTAFTAKRWGRYQVELTYKLPRAPKPVQFRLGEQRLKKTLKASAEPVTAVLGEIYIEQAGDAPFAIMTPSANNGVALEIVELLLVPAPETLDAVTVSADGAVTLPARAATTWSENMRYEPKPEKDCLGFWTEMEDFAEWTLPPGAQPGRYRVTVTQGCGEGQGGSRVAVAAGDGEAAVFEVVDTGGFQNWREVEAGVIEIPQGGGIRITARPLDKKGKAVVDIQQIKLTPAG